MAIFNRRIDSTNGQFAVWGLGVWIPKGSPYEWKQNTERGTPIESQTNGPQTTNLTN